MKVVDLGHKYLLKNNRTGEEEVLLTFFKDDKINGNGYKGTTNQEVLRALIDRIKFLDKQKYHRFNKDILYYLRMALILHEERHLERLVEEGYEVENIETKPDHFVFSKNK